VVGEAMVLLTLADFILQKTGGDSMDEVGESLTRWRERLGTSSAPAHGGGAGAGAAAGEEAAAVGSGGDD
jgi:hypothetical protein